MKSGLGIGGLQLAGGALGSLLESDAVSAATAASGILFYCKSDLSNVYTDSGTTLATTVGQAVGQVNPVVGSGYFRQNTAGNRPLLSSIARGYGLTFDGTDDFMSQDTPYFASADDTFVVASFLSGTGNANRVVFHNGNTGANVRYPYLAVNASDVITATWRGDDTLNRACTGTTSGESVALVASLTKAVDTKKLFVNGVQEGSTETNAVGSIATISRARIGISNDTQNPFGGPIALIFMSKTLTDAQRISIERFAAYLIGSTYLG